MDLKFDLQVYNSLDSFLAPVVFDLIFNRGISTSSCHDEYFIDHFFINCSRLEIDFASLIGNGQEYYYQLIDLIAPLIASLTEHVNSPHISMLFVETIKGTNLSWIGQNQQNAISAYYLLEGSKEEVILSLLIITSIIERSLGNLVLNSVSSVPPLLKDLLSLKELSLLTNDTIVKCLQALIGSPLSLNIRNLVWHGFILPSQAIHLRRYGYFLFSILLTIGRYYAKDKFSERAQIVYHSNALLDYYPFINYRMFIDFLISLNVIHPDWHELLRYCISLSSNRPSYCLMLILPLFEFTLRNVYATVNECTFRVISAQSCEFYITFAQILSQTLSDNITANKFILQYPQSLIELMMDLFLLPEGLRIRDRLSHGQVDLHQVPNSIVNFVLCTFVGVISITNFRSLSTIHIPDSIQNVIDKTYSYKSLCHPSGILRMQLIKIWKCLKYPSTVQETIVNSVMNELNCETHLIIEKIEKSNIPTLFRPRNEAVVIKLFRQISTELEKCIITIFQTLKIKKNKMEEKQLRSSQRINLNRLINSLEKFQKTIGRITSLITWVLLNVDSLSFDSDKQNNYVKKYKKLLKWSQNMNLASQENRWIDMVNIASNIDDIIKNIWFKDFKKTSTST